MTSATKHLRKEATKPETFTHADMVRGLVKAGSLIADDLNADQEKGDALLGSARDLIEAGNALDLIKKWAVYNKRPEGVVLPSSEGDFADITDQQAHLLHMAVGIAGEAAELLEAVVKHIDGEPLDLENCIEELGDGNFYVEGFRQGIDVSRQTCLDHNIAKLGKRYEGHNYSDAQAQDRADKA